MHFAELLIIAVGVSMDAFAVSICKGLSVRRLRPSHIISASLWFGGFQALMPLIGYFIGLGFADLVSEVDHWIAFVLLGFIGGKMIKEACEKDDGHEHTPDFSFKTTLAYDGHVENGILKGNLHIIGGGDPTLASKDSIAIPIERTFAVWEKILRDNGIREIEGQGSMACCSPWGHKESDTTQ